MKIKGDLLFGLVLSMSAFTASATILGNIAITPNSPATTKENVDRLTLESIESYVDLNKSMTLFNGADSIGSGESSLGGIVGLDVVSIEDSIQAAKDAADDAAADASVAQVTANSADTKATSANNLTSSLTTSKVVGGSCSPNGSLSKTSTGELLVCQGGSWQSSPDEYARKLALNPLLIYPNFTLACNTAGTAYQGRGRLE
ncbi:MAG: hypothetical protein IBX55_01565, partial [Methyloprofundus sp.]|nr:hypothetical protein [Methyloprofundus sp.]